jgi:hypothetical protein
MVRMNAPSTISPMEAGDLAIVLANTHTQTGKSLAELSDQSPLLLIFLRHFG